MPRRENAGARRRPVAQRRYTMLVYCGAVRTEPDYFDGLKRTLRRSGLTVKVRQEGIAPDALVRAAAAYRDRRPGSFDEVWCVVDVDDFDKKHVPTYDKARLDFSHYAAGVDDAVKRAKDLDATGVDHRRNPSTGMWRLVETILGRS